MGTTNITRLADYERAIGPATAAIMRIHPSNYRIRGFTASASLEELVGLGRRYNLPVIDDVGSGALVDLSPFGLLEEPIVGHSVAAGADLVLASGDKLLGGPQAGIVVGRRDLIQKMELDPLMRAFRLDKMSLAAFEATLRLYLSGESPLDTVPVLHMLTAKVEELESRALALADRLRAVAGLAAVEAEPSTAYAGGGAFPDQELRSWQVRLKPATQSDEAFAQRLRLGTPAVLSRIRDGWICFDLRTIFAEQEDGVIKAVEGAASLPR